MAATLSRFHTKLDRVRWVAVRRATLNRDGWRCRKCGTAGRLEVDHVVPLHKGGDLYGSENLQTLCRRCHLQKTSRENMTAGPERLAWLALVNRI